MKVWNVLIVSSGKDVWFRYQVLFSIYFIVSNWFCLWIELIILYWIYWPARWLRRATEPNVLSMYVFFLRRCLLDFQVVARRLWGKFMTQPFHRNQSIDLPCKSMGWFLYDRELWHERVKIVLIRIKPY